MMSPEYRIIFFGYHGYIANLSARPYHPAYSIKTKGLSPIIIHIMISHTQNFSILQPKDV